MLPFDTVTGIAAKGFGAGPEMFLPVSALNTEPWQGHFSVAPAGFTGQPRWVQIALNATALPAVGWLTMIGFPFS